MKQFDLIVIGAGPGGYVAAIRAAQLGMQVACIDANPQPGGTCLRVGCIPSKALLESSELYALAQHDLEAHGIRAAKVTLDLPTMLARKDKVVETLTRGVGSLFAKHKITHLQGTGRFLAADKVAVDTDGGTEELTAKSIIIATGSRSAPLDGVELDGERIVTSTEALSFSEVPEHLVVIGAGYIGLEMASVWKRLGSKVTVLEYLDRILPGMDAEIAREAQKLFARQGLEFRLGTRVTSAKANRRSCVVECEGADPIRCDRVLLAVGRLPNTAGLDVDKAGVALDERGRVAVDEHYQTSVPGIWAIGDVIAGPMLAHKAEDEGIACVEQLATGYGHVNYNAIPAVVYTHPEIASVGRTEEQLTDEGIEYRKGVFHFRGNGRAHALAQIDGRVKILADAETDRILGVHIIGPRAGDMIAEAAAAIEFGASSEDIARTSHAHPTLAEALREAAMAVAGQQIHG